MNYKPDCTDILKRTEYTLFNTLMTNQSTFDTPKFESFTIIINMNCDFDVEQKIDDILNHCDKKIASVFNASVIWTYMNQAEINGHCVPGKFNSYYGTIMQFIWFIMGIANKEIPEIDGDIIDADGCDITSYCGDIKINDDTDGGAASYCSLRCHIAEAAQILKDEQDPYEI